MGASDEIRKMKQRMAAEQLIARRSGKAVRPITGGVDIQRESLNEVLKKHRARMAGVTTLKAQRRVKAEIDRLSEAGAIPVPQEGAVPEPVSKTLKRKKKVAKEQESD